MYSDLKMIEIDSAKHNRLFVFYNFSSLNAFRNVPVIPKLRNYTGGQTSRKLRFQGYRGSTRQHYCIKNLVSHGNVLEKQN